MALVLGRGPEHAAVALHDVGAGDALRKGVFRGLCRGSDGEDCEDERPANGCFPLGFFLKRARIIA